VLVKKAIITAAAQSQRELPLQTLIDGDGKITACELVAGDASVASAMAKKLTGKSIARRPEGATAGIVVLTFASSR